MHLLDWLFVAVPLLLVLGIGLYAQRYMQSVADFMSGRRLAGRYLLAVASGEMQAGAVVFVASFERIANSGFTLMWWGWLSAPVVLIFSIAGFVVYRFRETRAMTLAQFFEIRYSRRFRLFTGGLGFLAGIANFGIIPAVGARCLVYFLGLPETVRVGPFDLPTFCIVMAVLLSITLALALAGGLITVMITDCVEGIVSQLFYLVIIGVLLAMFRWEDISATLSDTPPGRSLLNPFDSLALKDFNLGSVLMQMVLGLYGTLAWQNASAYKSASYNPHEGRMSGLLGQWREMGKGSVVTLLGVCALTFLHHPHYAAQATEAVSAVGQIANGQVRQQMQLTVGLSHLLPVGVKGMLCAVLLMGVFGGDSTHLHSWGSILVQDVFVPLRKQPFTPAAHIRALRWGIAAVAVFAFAFGCLFRQTEYIFMWWAVTQAIYVGGAGAAIIGGLYWKKGTTAGAWTALLTGSLLSVGGILARQVYGARFPFNGLEISFAASMIACAVYVGVSFLTCREEFNLERMLHRGAYAAMEPPDERRAMDEAKVSRTRVSWGRLIGFDETYTRADKWVAGGLFGWGLFWTGVLAVGTAWNFLSPWPLAWWSNFWQVAGIGIPVLLTVVTGVWFTWGGTRDIRNLFSRLRAAHVNHLDDGTVVGHHNRDEEMPATAASPRAD